MNLFNLYVFIFYLHVFKTIVPRPIGEAFIKYLFNYQKSNLTPFLIIIILYNKNCNNVLIFL
jgi:hypothetical protein